MVLQRDAKVRVWGGASPGESIELTFKHQRKHVVADKNGRWLIWLSPEPAGGPHELIVRGRNVVKVEDVLVGEVWLCGGQSNMEWALKDSLDGPADVAAADQPRIRHIKIARRIAFDPLEDIEQTKEGVGQWQVSTPATAGDFSAVGYHFARRLQQQLKVPIGLVNASWGGSNIETWMSREALAEHPEFGTYLPTLPRNGDEYIRRDRERTTALVRRWQPDYASGEDTQLWKEPTYSDLAWQSLDAPGLWESQGLDGFDGTLWYRRSIELPAFAADADPELHLGMVDDCDETYVNGQRVGTQCGWDKHRRYSVPRALLKAGKNVIAVRVTDHGGAGGFHGEPAKMKVLFGDQELSLAGSWKARVEAPLLKTVPAMNDLPSLAFNAMLNPLVGYGIRGALWYQGESNVDRAAEYEKSFPLLIADWRRRWGQGNFPFLYVQLASYLPLKKNALSGSTWAELREAQRKTLAVRNTGMAVTTDIGDANDIHPRNKREVGLRLAGLAMKLSYGGREQASGPALKSVRVVGANIELQFAEVAGGLLVKGDQLRGFTIADRSMKLLPAQARIIGTNKVVVSNPDVRRPAAVRFGWVDNPQESNLFNSVGLPASPFRTDQWPRITEARSYAY